MIGLAYTLPTGKIGSDLTAAACGLATRPLGRPDFDWLKPETFDAHLSEVAVLFANPLPSPDQEANERALYHAAARNNVGHIIKLSVLDATQTQHQFARLHAAGEASLRASGVPYTILRPTFFMQNALGLAQAIASGVFPAAMGNFSLGQIDTRDIADAVIAIARDPQQHAGKTYDLTGAQAFDGAQFAETFAATSGHDVQYVDLSDDQLRGSLLQAGLGEWYANGLVELYRYVRTGAAARLSDDLPRIIGRAPRSLDAFAREHAAAFAGR